MALFTVLLEFNGGMYISQLRAPSAQKVAAKHAARLIGNKTVGTLATRRHLAQRLAADKPVAIEDVRNVWCCYASVGNKSAVVNIVGTVEP